MPILLDNKGHGKVGDALAEGIQKSANISILSTLFSIYDYSALEKQLTYAKGLRLLIPSSDSLPAAMEPMPFRIKEISGDEADRRFRNKLNMTEISRRCAQWLGKKAQVKVVSLPVLQNLFHIENPDEKSIAIHGGSPSHQSGSGLCPPKAMK